jgi:hypothetical protein
MPQKTKDFRNASRVHRAGQHLAHERVCLCLAKVNRVAEWEKSHTSVIHSTTYALESLSDALTSFLKTAGFGVPGRLCSPAPNK